MPFVRLKTGLKAFLTIAFCFCHLLFCLISAAEQVPVAFNNFSEYVTLKPISGFLYCLGRNRVNISNRLVIKTRKDVTKQQIFAIDQSITRVVKLYELDNGIYWAVSFDDGGDIVLLSDRFNTIPFVISLQPDLLQLRSESTRTSAGDRRADYISEYGINKLWRQTKGKGVKVAVIDDGFNLNHEDLRSIHVAFSYDVESQSLDPSPKNIQDTHGTQVAGVIFAQHNQLGINGIAPESEMIAIRHTDTWTSKMLLSFYLAKLAKADVINCSWNSAVLLEPVWDVIRDLTVNGRGQKGVAVIFSAGNNGRDLSNYKTEASLSNVVTVGSCDGKGNRLALSNYGDPLDLCVLGENIVTTSAFSGRYHLFSGTSASAAIVSGLAALLISREPAISLPELNSRLKATLSQGVCH